MSCRIYYFSLVELWATLGDCIYYRKSLLSTLYNRNYTRVFIQGLVTMNPRLIEGPLDTN
jgi:hypothetical protein